LDSRCFAKDEPLSARPCVVPKDGRHKRVSISRNQQLCDEPACAYRLVSFLWLFYRHRKRSQWRLKYCTAFSCFFAAVFVLKVPRFFRLPVFGFFLREYSRYLPDFSFLIMTLVCCTPICSLAFTFSGYSPGACICAIKRESPNRALRVGLPSFAKVISSNHRIA